MHNVQQMLKNLEDLLRNGILTPAKKVDVDSVVCLTAAGLDGSMQYVQAHLPTMPIDFQEALINRPKGTIVGAYKIVAVFDTWDADLSKAQIPGREWI